MKNWPYLRHVLFLTLFSVFISVQFSYAWGKAGHRIINRVAVEMIPASIPGFMRTTAAASEIEYLGPEPDRWRSSAGPELNAAQAPDHFIDLELATLAAPSGLPALRYDFIRDLYRAQDVYPKIAARLTPERVGFLPWRANEQFERLEVDMREYRERLATHRPIDGAEQAILYDAGILGHYVADGSQPLHTTVDYNGWVETENPERFTRAHSIHSRFETDFVEANMRAENIRALVPVNFRILNSPFQDFVMYLHASHNQARELYRLDQHGGFYGTGTAESRNFTAERLAAGAGMLRDMIVTAWKKSARPQSSLF